MADPGAGESLTKGIFALITFDKDPNLKGVKDGSDEYVTLGNFAKIVREIGHPEANEAFSLATRSAVSRINPEQFKQNYESLFQGKNDTLRIQRGDIQDAWDLAEDLRRKGDPRGILPRAQKETNLLLPRLAKPLAR